MAHFFQCADKLYDPEVMSTAEGSEGSEEDGSSDVESAVAKGSKGLCEMLSFSPVPVGPSMWCSFSVESLSAGVLHA